MQMQDDLKVSAGTGWSKSQSILLQELRVDGLDWQQSAACLSLIADQAPSDYRCYVITSRLPWRRLRLQQQLAINRRLIVAVRLTLVTISGYYHCLEYGALTCNVPRRLPPLPPPTACMSARPSVCLSGSVWGEWKREKGQRETRVKLSCSALPAAKRFLLFPSGEWRLASSVRISVITVSTKKHLETTTSWTVTGFSVLSANFP